ncbi:aminotransferase [Streptomyces tubbatahanensis]|uniref:Aminotransferase n=1 Tax=Streptomyces tubbatahanensis TaxID=2923272 RepID=A0ABY3Y068_9ACTN|nr:glycogen debranching N-terminal domain-containing protein [Streptomyces tubbatahanensis]UNT00001.1 aminotransferase [Streptomyces tubbatahanensis]
MTATEHRVLVHDGTFAVLAPSGDLAEAPKAAMPHGLFRRDARHLSRWELALDGAPPVVLVPQGAGDGDGCAVLTPRGTREAPPACTVFREQAVADGALTELLRVVSNQGAAATVRLTLTADADFADQMELRAQHRTFTKPGAVRGSALRPGGVEFDYRRGADWHARTLVTADPAPLTVEGPDSGDWADAADEGSATVRRLGWELELPPHGTAELRLRVTALPHGAAPPSPPRAPGDDDPARVRSRLAAERQTFVTARPLPAARAGRAELARACEQGLADLAGLRVTVPGPDGAPVSVAGAGVPWFLTLFGRDSLLTSLFALPYRPETAEATLLALAATQAREEDRERSAEPGKIVHEVRHGELAAFGQVPYGRYYGSVDSTPLFLVLLGAYARQQGPAGTKLARRLEPQARAAVRWMFRWGGLDAFGYLAYRPHEGGLANQNWKDSPGAVCAADGTLPSGAVLVAEAQGYAYDALCATATLARDAWGDTAYTAELESAAAALRERFTSDFWLPDRHFVPLALDETGRRLDALASDAGHLLWSGILGQERGQAVGRRLMEPDFFSGWGIRTLAAGQAPYHPLSYHRGSIWPQDNALIALGLARYGLHEEVDRLAGGLLDAAARHGYRLPEVLAGYPRADHRAPVPYPHACSPQAWAAATPLALLTALEGGPARR